MSIYNKPSILGLFVSGLLILISLILIIKKYKEINNITFIFIILLFAILITLHSLLHLGVEISYNYNPIELIKKLKSQKLVIK